MSSSRKIMFVLFVGLLQVLMSSAAPPPVPVEQCISACDTGFSICERNIGQFDYSKVIECYHEWHVCHFKCISRT